MTGWNPKTAKTYVVVCVPRHGMCHEVMQSRGQVRTFTTKDDAEQFAAFMRSTYHATYRVEERTHA